MQKELFQEHKIWNSKPSSIFGIYSVYSFWLYERYASSAILIIIVIDFACSIIITSKTPGWVTIFLQRADGTKLGETKIWYYDEDKEALQRITENPKLQAEFFRNFSEMLSNRNTITASDAEAQNSEICGEWRIIDCI